jgi:hypothetical protein
VDFQDHIVVYRRYAALFLIIGIEPSDNELGVLEVMQLFVEVLDKYFKGANELDIMFRYISHHDFSFFVHSLLK